nr:Chain W, Peptide E131 [synthetic construct]1RPQ_X Chain X, Peptide E131 [synthetic construct]1RPQ_Y Chain Y, Peptide E131 [synthetic construct]1RPQ_Z Chain Z, Peptide E131 [synthetic construct]
VQCPHFCYELDYELCPDVCYV